MRWWDLWKDYTLFEAAPNLGSSGDRSCCGLAVVSPNWAAWAAAQPLLTMIFGWIGHYHWNLFAVVCPTARPPIGKGFKWLGIFYSQRSDWCSSSCGDTCLQVVLASKSQTDSQANMCLSNISDLPHDPWIVPQQYWSQLCVQQMPRIAKQICLHSHIIWCLSNSREDLAILCIWCVTFCRACHQDFKTQTKKSVALSRNGGIILDIFLGWRWWIDMGFHGTPKILYIQEDNFLEHPVVTGLVPKFQTTYHMCCLGNIFSTPIIEPAAGSHPMLSRDVGSWDTTQYWFSRLLAARHL